MAADDTVQGVKSEIEQARVSLAAAVDQIAYRTSPKRLRDNAKAAALAFARTPKGKAVLAGAGTLLAVVIVRRVVKH